MKITKENNNLVVRIPLTVKRFNPYEEMAGRNPHIGDMDNVVGLIYRHRSGGNNYDEMGFAYLIDMDYKDKGDQIGDWAVKYHGAEEDFQKLCQKLKISLLEV